MKEAPPSHETGRELGNKIPRARFDPGVVKVTDGAEFALQMVGRHSAQVLAEYLRGNWGNIHDHDKESNEQSADLGGTIIAAYNIEDARIYVRTDPTAEGNVTTIFLLHED